MAEPRPDGRANAKHGIVRQKGDVVGLVGARGIIHWEILPRNTIITATVYCEQLDRVAAKLRGKQGRVWYLHDNARPHIARTTNDKFRELGWEVIPHPSYSPELAPTDYHLFLSLTHHLAGRSFETEDDLKTAIADFFDQIPPNFCERGILSLPGRWRQVIASNGAYVNEALLPQ